ncbi:MAG TPA: C-GCAxxG-C-C family protein [Bacteroidales bacterium]|nr:C-GCAxxG-C-C family protein [Bacteroidales bacterium]
MEKKEKALKYFRDHFNCSQSVFTVFGTEYGLTENQCLKASCAFGGGMGRQQNVCGAVTGAMMALGIKYGKAMGDTEEKKKETYNYTKELFAEFIKLNGTVNCRELLKGYNMNDPDDHKKIVSLKLFDTYCEKYVVDAVEITEKIINK